MGRKQKLPPNQLAQICCCIQAQLQIMKIKYKKNVLNDMNAYFIDFVSECISLIIIIFITRNSYSGSPQYIQPTKNNVKNKLRQSTKQLKSILDIYFSFRNLSAMCHVQSPKIK